MQPRVGIDNVGNPAVPAGFAKVARAVATTTQVDLQHRVASLRQCVRLQRGHAARFVQFFGKRVDVKHTPTQLLPLGRVG